MPLLGDKQIALIEGETGSPYRRTNRLPLLGDKQVALIEGQTSGPYWGTSRFSLLGDKQDVLTGDKQVPLLGVQCLRVLRDKQVSPEEQTGCPCCLCVGVTNRMALLGDKQVALVGGQPGCLYWGTGRLPLLGDKQVVLVGGTMAVVC